jgi:ORF6N domain
MAIASIERSIFLIRGQRVMLDRDLAPVYGVEVRALNQAVRRNKDRFPSDFMFQLTREESERSRSQTVILDAGQTTRGRNIKYLSLAFTEQGVGHAFIGPSESARRARERGNHAGVRTAS